MKKSITLNLSTPCSEKWENFTPTERGGFCSSCTKEVIDFTSLSEYQIIEFFKSRPKNSCGRFRPEQLKTYHFQNDSINPGWRLWRAGVVAIGLAAFSKPSFSQISQEKPKTEQGEHNTESKQVFEKRNTITVSGIIHDLDDSAIPGVNIIQLGTSRGAMSDAEGRFHFTDLMEGDSLAFSFIGFHSQTKIVTGSGTVEMTIQMNPDMTQLGGVIVGVLGGYTTTNRISFRRWWWKLKGLFQ